MPVIATSVQHTRRNNRKKKECRAAFIEPRSLYTGNESVPTQLAQCRFPGLAISNAKIYVYFSHKIYGSNFIKQHSGTVMACNYQNADCS